MTFLIDLIRETVAIFLSTAPFLLFGFLLAGVLRAFVPAEWLRRTLGKRSVRSVAISSVAGIPLPLCSCSVLPTAAALRRSGASRGSIASFVIATPETGVDSISITYALMDPLMTVARPMAAMGTALAAGTAVNFLERGEPEADAARAHREAIEEMPSDAAVPVDVGAAASPEGDARETPTPLYRSPGERLRAIFRYAYVELLDDIASWFVIGILLSGFISAVIPTGALQDPALRGLPAMLAMLVIGIPLYVCATSSTPLAATLLLKGLSPGPVMVFLLAGPATNATTIAVLGKLLGRRTVVVYLLSIAVCSILAGYIVEGLYASSGIDASAVAGAASQLVPDLIRIPAALLLLGLILSSAGRTGMLSRWREGLRRLGRPLRLDLGGRPALTTYAVLFVLLYLLTGCSVVGPGEVGWVMTFGKVTRTVESPGLVVHWPYPIARLEKEADDLVRSIDRGYRQGQSFLQLPGQMSGEDSEELVSEAEVATGDENLISIRYSVQYRVSEPYTYRFQLDDPEGLVASFAEYALRHVVCTVETDTILVDHHIELALETAQRLRTELDAVGAGIDVLRVDLLDIHAPSEVHFAFRDVASAMEDNHRFIRQAESYRNRSIASARGQAFRREKRAQGDQLMIVADAQGRGHAFAALDSAYRAYPGVTRMRMYLDAAQRNLARSKVVLPLADLPLDLWLTRTARAWQAPWGGTLGPAGASSGGAGEGASAAPSASPEAGAPERQPSTETWREKMRKLQENPQ